MRSASPRRWKRSYAVRRQIGASPGIRRRYGGRLAIASLAALEKGTDEGGELEVRALHDGTHGVSTNRFIKVLDGGTSPMAMDLKTCLRLQAARRRPHCGLTVDVKSA